MGVALGFDRLGMIRRVVRRYGEYEFISIWNGWNTAL